jgi:large subunit ribosomal protein L17
MAVIELVLEPLTAKQATIREAEAAAKTAAKTAAPAAPAAEPVTEPVEASAEATADEGADFGPDSTAPLADGSAPEGFEVKGNKDSNKYHVPGTQWYDATVAEVYFRTAEAAEAAGFTEAGKKTDA